MAAHGCVERDERDDARPERRGLVRARVCHLNERVRGKEAAHAEVCVSNKEKERKAEKMAPMATENNLRLASAAACPVCDLALNSEGDEPVCEAGDGFVLVNHIS